MNWININTAQSRDPRWMDSTWIERGAWLSMVAYCTERETDGVIVGARLWSDRQWLIALGGLLTDISPDALLWSWSGDDLHLEIYPHDLQATVIARREAGRKGGQVKSEAKTEAVRANGNVEKAKQKQSKSKATSKPKEMERKEKESKYTLSYQSAVADERERDWEKVWSAFPKKIDEIKSKKLFLEHTVSAQRIIDSLTDWSATDEWTRDNGRWIPLPTTWLGRAGWNEQPTQITQRQKEPVRCTL